MSGLREQVKQLYSAMTWAWWVVDPCLQHDLSPAGTALCSEWFSKMTYHDPLTR